MNELPLYHIVLTREGLNELVSILSNNGIVDVEVDEYGEISFNIPKDSDIDIRQLDIVKELFAESERLEKRQKKLKEGGKKWVELEEDKKLAINCAVKVMKVLQKHFEDAIID